MTKPIGYFGGNYDDPAIAQFSKQFEDMAGNPRNLSANDQAALVSVLGVHGWGLTSGLEEDFWKNVDCAIGDGIETSLESDDDERLDDENLSPMALALRALANLTEAKQCYSLIAWLVQWGKA